MIDKYLKNLGIKAKIAARNLNKIDLKKRNKTLETFSRELKKNKNKIIKANIKDLRSCKRDELIDRLVINQKVIEDIRSSIDQIIRFKDPLGRIVEKMRSHEQKCK